jgi:hypothetical protein
VDNNKSYYISEAHWASVLHDVSGHVWRERTTPSGHCSMTNE